MNNEELKLWFLDKFRSCYAVEHIDFPNQIFWYYDKSYIRKLKLSRLNNTDFILPSDIKGVCLFRQDISNKVLFCDSENIWDIISKNYNSHKINDFVYWIIRDEIKLNGYFPSNSYGSWFRLEEVDKLVILGFKYLR